MQRGGGRLHRPARERDRVDGLEDARPRDDARRRACRSCPGRPSPRPTSTRPGRPPRRSATRSPARRPAAAAARDFGSRRTADELAEAFEGAAREGERFFSDDRVYLERYLDDPRHVEVQVLADSHGNVVHLGERDCSIQRRHQKLIEEAPGPHVDAEMRERIGRIATDAARAVSYRSAGTVEGMQVGEEYFFLEMNTRVQVEHCVTEMVTGVDIVREQVLIAAGEELSVSQEAVELRGHAIECRINAEAAHKNFAPAPGRIEHYVEPGGPGVRVDSGLRAGLGGDAALRPDGREADRLGRRPRACHGAHAAGARRVRDRAPADPDPVPPRDPGHRAVGKGRDLPRPDRGPRVAAGARPARRRTPPMRAPTQEREDRANLHGRGRRTPAQGEGDRRRGGRRRRAGRRQAAAAARAQPGAPGAGRAARHSPPRFRARSSRSPSTRAPRSRRER